MVTDYRNRICDCRKASFKGHQDWKNLDVTTNFSDFNSLTTSSKTIFAIFWNSKPNLQEHDTGDWERVKEQ